MRRLANSRYGLNVGGNQDYRLRAGEECNLFDILRNLDSFISRHSYDMVEQRFVPRKPDRISRNFGVQEAADAISGQGTGVLSLAVRTYLIERVCTDVTTYAFLI